MSSSKFVSIKQLHYEVPAAVMWETLTDSSAMAEWLMPNDFKAEEGASFSLDAAAGGSWEGRVECVLEEYNPDEMKMVWAWQAMKRDSKLTIAIEDHGKSCFLLILHEFGTGLMPWLYSMAYKGTWAKVQSRKLPAVLKKRMGEIPASNLGKGQDEPEKAEA